eukprot:5841637-Amphidinium_carterae.1
MWLQGSGRDVCSEKLCSPPPVPSPPSQPHQPKERGRGRGSFPATVRPAHVCYGTAIAACVACAHVRLRHARWVVAVYWGKLALRIVAVYWGKLALRVAVSEPMA